MTGQTELVFDPHTHAHRGDPDTSHQAARNAPGTARRHCDLIAEALSHCPTRGLTASELADVLGLEMVQVNRRASDLVRTGRAHRRGVSRLNARGNAETVLYPGAGK